jgi:TonB family protein
MRMLRCVPMLLALVPVWSSAQAPDSSTSPSQTDDRTDRTEVYYGGPGVTMPKLLAPPETPAVSGKCRSKQEARVILSLIVDSQGQPRNATFDQPMGNAFDEFALMILERDRFEPGTYQGAPAAVGLALKMHLQGCVERTKNAAGKNVSTLKLRSLPEQDFEISSQPQQEAVLAPISDLHNISDHLAKVGHGVTPPRAILQREAAFSDYARQKKIQGTCVVSLVVDAHGMPQNVHVVRSLEPSLDQNAVESVRNYRFRPAMRYGSPVATTISVEVTFRLY